MNKITRAILIAFLIAVSTGILLFFAITSAQSAQNRVGMVIIVVAVQVLLHGINIFNLREIRKSIG